MGNRKSGNNLMTRGQMKDLTVQFCLHIVEMLLNIYLPCIVVLRIGMHGGRGRPSLTKIYFS